MVNLGDRAIGTTLSFDFNTHQADGTPITLAGTPVISVYKNSTTESTSGVTLTVDYDARTGMHHVVVDTSADGTFYATGNDFSVVVTTGTVNAVSVVGTVVARFSLGRANISHLAGTVLTGRDVGASVLLSSGTGTGQLDVTSGVVKANATQILGTAVSTPATAGILDVNLKNIANAAVSTSTAQLGVNLVNIAGAAVNTASAQLGVNVVTRANIDFGALQKTSLNAATPASVTGAVGSVTGAVGSIAANGITATSIATDAINAASVKADAVTKIQNGLATPTNITAGVITTVTNLTNAPTNGDLTATMKTSVTTACTASTPTISTLGANTITATSIATGAITSAKFAAGAIDATAIAADAIGASELAADAVTEIAAGVWGAARSSFVADGTMGQNMALCDSGTAQTGAGTTITLRAGTSAVNDFYDGAIVQIVGGTGAGQARVIKQYVGASKLATVADGWGTTPDNTSVYIIRGLGDVEVGINNDKTGYSLAADQAVNVTKWNGTTVATPATAGIPDVNVKNINNVATTSVTTVNANQGTTQPTNYTGTGATAYVKSDMVDIAGAAVSTSAAQIGVNAVNIGGTAQTGRDIGASVLLSPGTGTGQVSLNTGVVASNTVQIDGSNLTTHAVGMMPGDLRYIAGSAVSTTIAQLGVNMVQCGTTPVAARDIGTSVLLSVGGGTGQVDVSGGVVKSNLVQVDGITLTTHSAGKVPADLRDIVGASVSTSIAQIGVNVVSASGGVPAVADIADAVWDEQLGGHTTAGSSGKALADAASGSSPATIADAVWDEAIAGHLTAGTTGAKLNSAAAAGDPWSTAVPGAYGTGTAGYIVGTNLDAKSSDIKTQTDKLQFDGSNNIKSVKNATSAGTTDFNATEKASITTACTASTPTADANLTKILGTAVSSPATAGILDVNVKNMNNVAATSITTINANQGTTQPVNYTGTGVSALVKSDMVDVAGAAVSTSSAQIGVNVVTQSNIDFGALQKASLNAATPASVTGAVGSVTGNVGGSVGSVAANGITSTSIATDAINAASVKADAVTKIQNGLATPTNITAGTITTVTNLTNAPTNGDFTATMKSSITAAVPTVDGIADGVWDEATSGHSTAGSTGKALIDASAGSSPSAIADAVWDEALSGHTTAGTAGKALSDAGGAGTVDANIVSIDGQLTTGNNATLNLKKLNIVNSAGDALVATSSGGNGSGIKATGEGTGSGMLLTAGGGANSYDLKGATPSTNIPLAAVGALYEFVGGAWRSIL
jgi:hypothetical protein